MTRIYCYDGRGLFRYYLDLELPEDEAGRTRQIKAELKQRNQGHRGRMRIRSVKIDGEIVNIR